MPNSESPPSTAQSWAPPKNPLPPHRLARLANALGVSTPMPAIHTPTPMLSPSYNGSSPALDQYRRSPTPSTASTFGFSPVTSKYLLHVIPPIHLPHDSFDSELTPPPSTASGYHTQFRRGTLVPVHSTFQSQLGAIAKEYALPSTAGLILYLVSKPRNSPPPSASYDDEDEMDEPGPRLSEDIWRHLWTRVVKTELRDDPSPPLLGLGISSISNRSTPYLPQFPLPLLSTNINTPFSHRPPPRPPPLQNPPHASIPSPRPRHRPRVPTQKRPTPPRRRPSAPTRSTSQVLILTRSSPSSQRSSLTSTDGKRPGGDSTNERPPSSWRRDLGHAEQPVTQTRAAANTPCPRPPAQCIHSHRAYAPPGRRAPVGRGGERAARVPRRGASARWRRRKRKRSVGRARRSMYDPGKRRGDIYEDMDLGFEESSDDFDIDDPNDRRKSQIIMRAQLDEIEKNLAQFSPRMLRTDLEDQQMPTFTTASSSPNLSPPGSSASAFGHDDLSQQAAWPAVPYNSRTERPAASPAAGQQHFPPQLAVNGVSASMPKRFLGTGGSSSRASSMHSTASSESELRKRDLAENYPSSPPAPYPAFTPSIGPKSSLNSPLIPLSPDPFGRHPSQAPEIPGPSGLELLGVANRDPCAGAAPDSGRVTAQELERVDVFRPAHEYDGDEQQPVLDGLDAGCGRRRVTEGDEPDDADEREEHQEFVAEEPKEGVDKYSAWAGMPMESVNENAWSPLSPPLPTQRPGNPAVPLLSPPPMPSGNAGSNPPLGVPAPMRPNRPSMEDMELPDVDVQMPPMTPLSAGFPGRPVPRQGPTPPPLQPQPQPRPSLQERRPSNASSSQSSQDRRPSMSSDRRPSMSSDRRPSVSQERRPSQDASRRASPEGTPLHSPHPNQLGVPLRRPSPEQVPPLPHPARRPSDAQSQMSMPSHQPQMSMQSQMSIQSHQSHMSMHSQSQLIVPPPMLQSTRNTPIIATKAGPPRSAMNDGLLWDQESPYPTRMTAPAPARAPSVGSSASRPSSRPPSPPSGYQHHSPTPPPQNTSPPLPHNSPPLPHNSPPLPHNSSPLPRHSPPPMPPHPSPPIQEKERRNSWKSQTNGGTAVPAPLTPSSASMSGSPSQGSPMNLPIDIPPSPKIPEQFIASFAGNPPPPPAPPVRPNSAAIARRRLSAKMSQHHRPRESTASSSTSLDTSGFEIVSPKMSGTLSFPYTEMDHDRPLVDGVRM
ncbi:hypothetical protein K438DRAFT_1819703 [Mycena galopus ATCC 62051]|nr:hypothetical protein K438DRAFT_1819703 [Mycena galopus ATCC 62051]